MLSAWSQRSNREPWWYQPAYVVELWSDSGQNLYHHPSAGGTHILFNLAFVYAFASWTEQHLDFEGCRCRWTRISWNSRHCSWRGAVLFWCYASGQEGDVDSQQERAYEMWYRRRAAEFGWAHNDIDSAVSMSTHWLPEKAVVVRRATHPSQRTRVVCLIEVFVYWKRFCLDKTCKIHGRGQRFPRQASALLLPQE